MQNAGVEINPDVGSPPSPEAIVLTTLLGFHEDDARRKMRPFLNIQIPSVLPMRRAIGICRVLLPCRENVTCQCFRKLLSFSSKQPSLVMQDACVAFPCREFEIAFMCFAANCSWF